MAYLGLVPSEHSKRQLAAAGRDYPCRKPSRSVDPDRGRLELSLWPRPSKAIAARRRQVAPGVRTIAEKAEERLHRRFTRLTHRGKKSQAVVTAVARELVGFVWAIAREQRLLAACSPEGRDQQDPQVPSPRPPTPFPSSLFDGILG